MSTLWFLPSFILIRPEFAVICWDYLKSKDGRKKFLIRITGKKKKGGEGYD